ncbi:MAG: N-6 DNA methylase [Prosthecobacter sp.]
MTLEELLSSLGYDGSPCFLKRDDGRFESEMGYGHIFRRAREPKDPDHPKKEPRWQAEGVYGIRESADANSRFTPIVYVCTAKDEAAASELHRLLWNQDVAPYIIVHTCTGLRVYSGFTYSPKATKAEESGVLQELTAFNTAKSIVQQFHRREIDEGRLWQHPHLRVDPSKRVYHRLLGSLRELDKTLQQGRAGLSKDVSHALIGKYVYLRYLRDRGILSDERLAIWDLTADNIFGPKARKGSLEKLSDCLDEWLNGEIFPLPMRGEHSPSVEQIQAVAGAFRGDEHSGGAVQSQFDFEAFNFSFIPIETLSLVYEQFLHTEDPKAKKDGKATKTKGRKEGAYYTPLPLVNFMLAALERQKPLKRGMKVFDPSSGSGSFVVQAYRLLIEKTFPVTKTKPKPKELRELLEESIFGCDVDGDACQVTQLSLLLTLLDYVDPPDLTGSMHSFKLPTLCETKNEEKLAKGHTPNILKHNFFGIESKLGFAAVRRHGAIADWKTQGFDWIVGNPPWKKISPKKLGENDGPVWKWLEDHEKSKPVGLNQAAQAFAWEAPRFLRSDGECALLVPAMGLFEEPSEDFRRTFFSAFQVHQVANFANLAEVLFDGRARVPAAAISYRNRPDDGAIAPDEAITIFSPFVVNQEATRPLAEGERGKIWSLSINASEVRSLEQEEAASGSGLPWKLAMWGSPWDERLLTRLEKKWPALSTLEARWDRKAECFISDEQMQIIGVSQGLELREEPEKNDEEEDWPDGEEPKPIKEASGAKALDTDALDRLRHVFCFTDAATPRLEKRDWFGREGRVALPLTVCRAPHVLVSAARNFAVYSDEFVIVPARQIGIVSCSGDKDFLKALSLFLSSDFAFYHQFFRSTELGVKRDRATLESLRKMPIPLTSLTRAELKEWSALHAKLIKCKPRKLEDTKKKKTDSAQQDFFDEPDDGLVALLEQLNNMTADVLGLSKDERSLVHDLVQVRYALNDGKRGEAAMRVPEPKEQRAYAKTLKDELDDFVGDFAGRSHKITVVADAASAMIEIDFTTDHKAARRPSIHAASDAEAKALNQTRNRLLKDEGAWQWTYFDRNLRIYRGRKTYLFKPLHRFHWTVSAALTDASQIIAETLSGT